MKELAKAIINDLNENYEYVDMPVALQRRYCTKFLGEQHDNENGSFDYKVNQLVEKFSEINTKIEYQPFIKSNNKNPNPNIVETIFLNFGQKKVFACLNESQFDGAFSMTSSELKEFISNSKEQIKEHIKTFPYSSQRSDFSLSISDKQVQRTLWQEFLDESNKKRHEVAHGNDFDNFDSISVLESRKDKILLLQLALVELMACHLSEKLSSI
ncbi:HEPN domain-containing protein [Hydrogenovibrio sp. JE_KL2]|uniref:HEPN domain-containing protein n=1 Tax=Hydrogenovibrio sp. JE_KL2 TaxID=2651188 RepID=UPI00128CE470|nr:HEPN domain-containing protein [Hydrogenovibrio sp. JE_KL2]MPQ76165.1 hypothetical protein [Hydrogenovibrio sp. JE_KL2]